MIDWKAVAAKAHEEREWYERFVEDCTCDDPDASSDCWYRLSSEEQEQDRIDHVARMLEVHFGD
jgi:hypothetical protein